jgi:ribosomal protein S8
MVKYIFLRNALSKGIVQQRKNVFMSGGKKNIELVKLLIKIGYLSGYTLTDNTLEIFFKYNNLGDNVLRNIVLFGKRSRQFAIKWRLLRQLKAKTRTLILSTTAGILVDDDALRKRLGGIILFIIY